MEYDHTIYKNMWHAAKKQCWEGNLQHQKPTLEKRKGLKYSTQKYLIKY